MTHVGDGLTENERKWRQLTSLLANDVMSLLLVIMFFPLIMSSAFHHVAAGLFVLCVRATTENDVADGR